MDTISYSGTRVLEIFYMHQENNAPFMTKNVNFAFFPWTLLGHSKKHWQIPYAQKRYACYREFAPNFGLIYGRSYELPLQLTTRTISSASLC